MAAAAQYRLCAGRLGPRSLPAVAGCLCGAVSAEWHLFFAHGLEAVEARWVCDRHQIASTAGLGLMSLYHAARSRVALCISWICAATDAGFQFYVDRKFVAGMEGACSRISDRPRRH